MGRLSRSTPSVGANYNKLVDELSSSSCDSLKIVPTELFLYSCRNCGHKQRLSSEELNLIVGNAFKMAYAAQLQKQTSFQDVITGQSDQSNKVLWTKELTSLKKEFKTPPDITTSATEMNQDNSQSLRVLPPTSIPGLKPSHQNSHNKYALSQNISQNSTPSSEESNSPTEMNSYKKMQEKPLLIKKILGLTVNNNSNNDNDEDVCPLVCDSTPGSTPGSPTKRPLSGGYVNERDDPKTKSDQHLTIETALKNKRLSISSGSSSGQSDLIPTSPPLPERNDSLNNKEEGELRLAPWFQAGIPREIALEILAREPVGAFMVRESTSKPGCFALSLRVPRSFQPTGIAHYLIIRANKGYKIKGFTKEFTSLTSLITHHSVMPELLPCPLSLSRYHKNFSKNDTRKDFADIDLEQDYNTLTDFRKMMADINI